MKLIYATCLGMIVLNVVSEDNNYQPKVYADITKQAQEQAVKYDGIKLLFGLGYSFADFNASLTDRNNNTKNSMNHFMLTIGCDYSKALKHNIILGASLLMDIWKKQKKSNYWSGLNADYDSVRGHLYGGNKDGDVQNSSLIPEISLKAGYIFKSLKSYAGIKLGVIRLEGTYRYRVNNYEISSTKYNGFTPFFGFVAFKNINNKFGVMIEINKSLNKKSKRSFDSVEQQTKMNSTTVRILGTIQMKN